MKPKNLKSKDVNPLFLAQIHHLGFFEDEQEAARVYDRAVVELRGAAAVTNFPLSAGAAARVRQVRPKP